MWPETGAVPGDPGSRMCQELSGPDSCSLAPFVVWNNKFARIELKDRPILLKSLDLPTRLTKPKAKHQTPKKATVTRQKKKAAKVNSIAA